MTTALRRLAQNDRPALRRTLRPFSSIPAWVACLLISNVTACSPETPLIDDPEVASLAHDPAILRFLDLPVAPNVEHKVVLLVGPGDCLTCLTPVARWVYWAREHPDQFRLVFTSPPNGVARRRLIPLRLLPREPDILETAPLVVTPLELVFANRQLIYASQLSPANPSSDLLRGLATGRPLDGAVKVASAIASGDTEAPPTSGDTR